MIDGNELRQAFGLVPTSVCVVTTTYADESFGCTVGTVTSASLAPPLIGFLLTRRSSTLSAVQSSGRFAVNVLTDQQTELGRQFAGPVPQRFDGVVCTTAVTGSPILPDVLVWADCHVEAVHDAGDHSWVLGRVHALQVTDAQPLVFHRQTLRALHSTDPVAAGLR